MIVTICFTIVYLIQIKLKINCCVCYCAIFYDIMILGLLKYFSPYEIFTTSAPHSFTQSVSKDCDRVHVDILASTIIRIIVDFYFSPTEYASESLLWPLTGHCTTVIVLDSDCGPEYLPIRIEHFKQVNKYKFKPNILL